MTVPTSNYRSGRLMVRQDAVKIESRLSASETTGQRMLQGKTFDCTRGQGRVTTSDCLSRCADPDSPCTDRRGPCAIGFVAQQRAAGRL